MKIGVTSTLLGIFLVFTLAILPFASSDSQKVIFTTSVDSTQLIADGQTIYTAYVSVDNTEVSRPTLGVQWSLQFPSFMHEMSYSLPNLENDFFHDPRMNNGIAFEQIRPAGDLSAVATWFGQAVSNSQGRVQIYEFTVPEGTTPGTYSFDLSSIEVYDGIDGSPQDYQINNIPFTVVAPQQPIAPHNGGSECPVGTKGKCAVQLSKLGSANQLTLN